MLNFGKKHITVKIKDIKKGDQLLLNNDAFPVHNFIKYKKNYILTLDRSKIVKEKDSYKNYTFTDIEIEKKVSILRNKNLFQYIFGL